MSIQNFLFPPPPRILTCIRVLCSALIVSLFVLSAYAQDTVTRTNASGTVTDTDVATVQEAAGAANGDVLTLSGDATHNSIVDLTSTYNTFTVQSDSDVKRTINGTAAPLYVMQDLGNYTITLSNLNLSGIGYFIEGWGNLNLNVDNVSFSSFECVIVWWDGGNVQFSSGTFTFQNNYNGKGAGAIQVDETVLTFSGNDTTATFEGNIGSNGFGNDIHCGNLSFADRGKYSFDGGIYARGNTSINQAQVTIAGRQYSPFYQTGTVEEDTTNFYDLSSTTISNGGTLTANMDYINRLTGTYTLSGSESLITMNKGSDTATIKSSTGNGVATLNFISATDVETISISSGQIDVKGALEASLTLQNDATFSPGNSVGTLDLDGNFIAKSGILLFEQDATGMDKLIANSFDIADGVQLQLVFKAAVENTMYDIIVAKNGFTTEQSVVSFWEALLTNPLPEGMRMSVVGGNTVQLTMGSAPTPAPVPEPTTWALLILGSAGLMYWRKKGQKRA